MGIVLRRETSVFDKCAREPLSFVRGPLILKTIQLVILAAQGMILFSNKSVLFFWSSGVKNMQLQSTL